MEFTVGLYESVRRLCVEFLLVANNRYYVILAPVEKSGKKTGAREGFGWTGQVPPRRHPTAVWVSPGTGFDLPSAFESRLIKLNQGKIKGGGGKKRFPRQAKRI